MFKSLQARLTLSHISVILVCLVLVGVAALLLLRGYQQNLMFRRLADRATLAGGSVALMVRRGVSPEEMMERLSLQMHRDGSPKPRLYLLDQGGLVIAASDEREGSRPFGQMQSGTGASVTLPGRGVLRLPAGERLLYVAESVRVPAEEGRRSADFVLVVAEVYQPLRLALGDLVPRLLWAAFIAMGLSVVLAALIAYSIARPLERIAQAAEEVAAGSFDRTLDIAAPTEVARLASSFNSMARRVKDMLQSHQDLVANVSHELKTPLTSIQGFSQALVDGTAGDAAAQLRAAIVIQEEAGRMRRLVDDLLDLARLEAGEVNLRSEPVDVSGLMRGCAERYSALAEQSGTTLVVEVSQSLPKVVGDADRLEQVFANLVDNAIKYASRASSDGQVTLGAVQDDGMILCSVTDNGPGIPAEELDRIFERFYQVDKSRSRRLGGAGLGLCIAQRIILGHGGRIRAESVQGLGTRITVELPMG